MDISSLTKMTVVAALVLCGTAPAASAAGGAREEVRSAVWERLAECESSGNWAANTGNGYYGGLQFTRTTWDSFGGGRFASEPHQASKAEQIAIATAIRDAGGGYGAWPVCARKLGLPK